MPNHMGDIQSLRYISSPPDSGGLEIILTIAASPPRVEHKVRIWTYPSFNCATPLMRWTEQCLPTERRKVDRNQEPLPARHQSRQKSEAAASAPSASEKEKEKVGR